MSRRAWLVACIAATFSTPAFAQSDSTLAAKVDTLLMVMGDYTKVIPCSELDTNRPTIVLGDGGYPERFRLKQIGCAIDAAVALVGSFQNQMTALASRLATVESVVAGGQPAGTAVFDNIRVRGKVCIGDIDCDYNKKADIQIRKNYDGLLCFESNLSLSQAQSPRPHIGCLSLSTDGGLRLQQNATGYNLTGFVTFIDPCREWTNVGMDSRGSFSYYRGSVDSRANPFTGEFCTALPHDNTQDLVLSTDEASRSTTMLLWRPNWSMVFKMSSCIYCADLTYTVPKQ